MDRYPPGRGVPPPAGKYSAARSHVMNDKYMEDFEKAWEEMRAMGLGGGGGGPGGPGGRGGPASSANAAAARVGSSFAAQQRGIYAALEEPSPRCASPSLPSLPGGGSGYGRPPAGSSYSSPSASSSPYSNRSATTTGGRIPTGSGSGGTPPSSLRRPSSGTIH
ncbi:hypothetical protein Agub_g7089, partial [Astrephomene gubernaculifera]